MIHRHLLGISVLLATAAPVSCQIPPPAPKPVDSADPIPSLRAEPPRTSQESTDESPADAKSGVIEFFTIDSKLLSRAVEVGVYLPPGYSASQERYPTLYFFHGRNGISHRWKEHSLPKQLDDLISSGKLVPLVIAFPNCGSSMYVNWRNGEAPWQDFFATELIAAIDGRYRTLADRTLRGAEGDAAGGFGALLLTLQHPELFGSVGTHAAAIYPSDPAEASVRMSKRASELGPVFGWPIDAANWQRVNPLHLARTLPEESLKQLAIYFDCGVSDREQLDVTNKQLHEILEGRGIPHEWHLRPDAPRRDYFQENVEHSLLFHGRQFAAALKALQKPR